MTFLLSACSQTKIVSKECFGFHKSDFKVVEEHDTHGGFHGDGSYYLILDCTNNKEKALKNLADWPELPLSKNLELIMYGGEKRWNNLWL